MIVYITNYSLRKAKELNTTYVVLHHNKDCKQLNSPYKKGTTIIPNSGVNLLTFESEEIAEDFLAKFGCKCLFCSICECVHSHDEYLMELKKEQELYKEIVESYDEAVREGRIEKLS